jgi:hypothetical protein
MNPNKQRNVPDMDVSFEELGQQSIEARRRTVTAWCESRPEASGLSIRTAYHELLLLDAKEQSMLLATDIDGPFTVRMSGSLPATLLQNDARAEIVQAFDPRRQLLRSRALDLSRYSLRPLKVTDLPLEVLRIVFNHFQEDAITESRVWHRSIKWQLYHPQQSRKRLETILKTRLVCRLFCELATPLLFPILHIQLNQASLDFVDRISKIPAMAASVQGIRLSLGYRPKDFADSLAQYKEMRLATLMGNARHIRSQYARHYSEGDTRTEAVAMRQALDNADNMRREWGEYVDAVGLGEVVPEESLSEYQKVLRHGHAEFRGLHEEQDQLLRDRLFADSLASAVARMPNARSFAFLHEPGPDADIDDVTLLTNNEFLSRFMSSPLEWREIEQGSREVQPAELECARLMWEIPIALHKAGVTVKEIRLQYLPRYHDFSQPCPQGQTWCEDLATACADVEALDCFDPHCMDIMAKQLREEDKTYIDSYVGSILSRCGRQLRVLEFNLDDYTFTPDDRLSWWHYNADSFLSRLSGLPRLRQLTLRNMDIQQRAFDALCTSLGDSLQGLQLHNIKLRKGRWATAVDLLRQKMTAAMMRVRDAGWPMEEHASLSYLEGGEFGDPDESEAGPEAGDAFEPRSAMDPDLLLAETQNYIWGIRETNPLRAHSCTDDV